VGGLQVISGIIKRELINALQEEKNDVRILASADYELVITKKELKTKGCDSRKILLWNSPGG